VLKSGSVDLPVLFFFKVILALCITESMLGFYWLSLESLEQFGEN
jgi:hypothetical protein